MIKDKTMKLKNIITAVFLGLSVLAVCHAADQKIAGDKINGALDRRTNQASLADNARQNLLKKEPGCKKEILSKDVGFHPDMKKLPPKGSYYEYDALGRITRIVRIK